LTITATDNAGNNPANVTLWYRHSTDNSSWGEGIPEGMDYYKVVNIANAYNNYTMRINLSYDNSLDGGENVTLNSNCNANFSDIRFYDIDNTTSLSYWIEEKVDSDYCLVWVNTSSDIATDNKFLLYYGEAGAVNMSNGTNTFLFFDDFEGYSDGDSLDTNKYEWRSVDVDNLIEIEVDPRDASKKVLMTDEEGDSKSTNWYAIFDENYTDCQIHFEGWSNYYTSSHSSHGESMGQGDPFEVVVSATQRYQDSDFRWYNQSVATYFPFIPTAPERLPNVWYEFTYLINPSNNASNFSLIWNASVSYEGTEYRGGYRIPMDEGLNNVTLFQPQRFDAEISYVDNIWVCLYTNPEPSWSSFGNEKSSGGGGSGWTVWSSGTNPDTGSPWSWNFDFPNGTGYYEFYSIAKKSGFTDESAPASKDAMCHYTAPVGMYWRDITTTIGDGTWNNNSIWHDITTTIGDGEWTNTTPALTWQDITTSIGDGTWSNSTRWQDINTTVGDGEWTNTTTAVPDIILIHDNDDTICEYYETWKESNTDFNVTYIDVDTITADSSYWVNGTWGDNTPSNPYYISQTISSYSRYNDTQAKIRNYIRYMKDTYDIDYVIMLGTTNVPVRYFTHYVQGQGFSDMMYYGCLNGTQNPLDGSTWTVSSGLTSLNDLELDLVVARLPSNDHTHLYQMINKSQNFSLISNNDIQATTMGIYSESLDDPYGDYDTLWTSSSGLQYSQFGGYNNGNIFTFVNGTGQAPGQTGPFENTLTQEQVTNEWVNIANGSNATHPNGWIIYDYYTHVDNGFPENDYFDSLTNVSNPFFCFGSGCSVGDIFSAEYQQVKWSLTRSAGGLVAFTGCSYDEWGVNIDRNRHYYDFLFSHNHTMGDIYRDILQYYLTNDTITTYTGWNYYGDPAITFPYHEVPIATNCSPDIGEDAEYGTINLSSIAYDFQGDTITNISLWTNVSGSWNMIQDWTSVASGTSVYDESNDIFTTPNIRNFYSWNVTDGTYWWNQTRHFDMGSQGFITFQNCSPFWNIKTTPSYLNYSLGFSTATSYTILTRIYNSSNNTWWTVDTNIGSGTNIFKSVANTSGITEGDILYLWSVNVTAGEVIVNKSFPVFISGGYDSESLDVVIPIGNDSTVLEDWYIYPSGEMYEAVDDIPPDYNTTYIYINGSDKDAQEESHWFEMGNTTENNIDYININMLTYNNFTSGNEHYFIIGLRNATDENDDYYYHINIIGDSHVWQNWSFNLTYNPFTNNSWTKEDINNLSIKVGIQDSDTGDGKITQVKITLYKVVTWHDVSTTIGDGSWSNGTHWRDITSTIGDGSWSNTTFWHDIQTTIGDGSWSNGTHWQDITTTLGDGEWTNISIPLVWHDINTTVGDGSWSNTTFWHDIQTTIGDGSWSNGTHWQDITTSIGDGQWTNTSGIWRDVQTTIGDGTWTNGTHWMDITTTIGDGSWSNETHWHDVSTTIGDGYWSNATILTWYDIQTTVGDGTWSNNTHWRDITTSIGDGEWTNTSIPLVWHDIQTTIGDGTWNNNTHWQDIQTTIGDGEWTNNTNRYWQDIQTTIGDGTWSNNSVWHDITTSIGDGEWANTTPALTWQDINTTIGDGTWSNNSIWHDVSTTIGDGSWSNSSGVWKDITTSIGDGTWSNDSVWHDITTTIGDGQWTNYTSYSWKDITTIIGDGTWSNTSLNTSVDHISPYEQTSSPLTITATDNGGNNPANVTLWYRFSTDNISWSPYEIVDNDITDKDNFVDTGNSLNFIYAQDSERDNLNMSLVELDCGVCAVTDLLYVNGRNTTYTEWLDRGITPQLGSVDGEYIHEDNTGGALEGYFRFEDNLSLSGIFNVTFSLYCWGDDADEQINIYYNGSQYTTITVPTNPSWIYSEGIEMNAQEINDLDAYLEYVKVSPADDIYVDAMRMLVTRECEYLYCVNQEYAWESIPLYKQNYDLCIYINNHTGTENLNVSYWNISLSPDNWSDVGIVINEGWNNFTLDSNYITEEFVIRFWGLDLAGDAFGDTWEIDCLFINASNSTENRNWTEWGIDTSSPWSWNFDFPDGDGYYEFYSIAKKSGYSDEPAPVSADAMCHFVQAILSWHDVSTTIGDGSWSNGSIWHDITTSIGDGTWSNASGVWHDIQTTIGDGQWTNASGIWRDVQTTIGDGTWTNNTHWRDITTTIGDGEWTNISIPKTWHDINTSIGDGSWINGTHWQDITTTIGDGEWSNTSILLVWYDITTTIGTHWRDITTTIGDGEWSNTSILLVWYDITTTIGDGSWSNGTHWRDITTTIGDGTWNNNSIWHDITTTIGDGQWTNTTPVVKWRDVQTTVGDGTWNNITLWKDITITIGDGTWNNNTHWSDITTTIGDGSWDNNTRWHTITSNMGDGTWLNTSGTYFRIIGCNTTWIYPKTWTATSVTVGCNYAIFNTTNISLIISIPITMNMSYLYDEYGDCVDGTILRFNVTNTSATNIPISIGGQPTFASFDIYSNNTKICDNYCPDNNGIITFTPTTLNNKDFDIRLNPYEHQESYKENPLTIITAHTTNNTVISGLTTIYPLIPTNDTINGSIRIKDDILYFNPDKTVTWINITYYDRETFQNITVNNSNKKKPLDLNGENVIINTDGNITIRRETTFTQTYGFSWLWFNATGKYSYGAEITNRLTTTMKDTEVFMEFSDNTIPSGTTVNITEYIDYYLEYGNVSYRTTDSGVQFYLGDLLPNETHTFLVQYNDKYQESHTYDEGIKKIDGYLKNQEYKGKTYYSFNVNWKNPNDQIYHGGLYLSLEFEQADKVKQDTIIILDKDNNNTELNDNDFSTGNGYIRISDEIIGEVLPNYRRNFMVYFELITYPSEQLVNIEIDSNSIIPVLIALLGGISIAFLSLKYYRKNKTKKYRRKK